MQPMGLLARALAFEELLARRRAQRLVPTEGGFAVLDDRYPVSYEHNQVYVTGQPAAAVILAEADRALAERRHRHVTVLDGELAGRLAPELLAAGYEKEAVVVMVLAVPPARPEAAVRVERVAPEDLRPAVMRTWAGQYPDLPEDSRRQLFERVFATAAACELSSHVVRVRGEVTSWCHLYRIGSVGQVESVNTLPEWRRRGFAKATVLDAVAAAAACELVFLVALRDDWPRHLYQRLGFAVVGGYCAFTRP
jgi:GNAT superfamily N-acetyltransferase